jgi:Protein of Unknown function (DUF2784)
MAYHLLADAVLVVHAGYLVYLAFGGFLAWRWRRWIWPHVVAVAWGLAVVAFSIRCPLTTWENALLEAAGEPTYASSFVNHYVADVVYPGEHLDQGRWLLVLVVAGSWLGAWLLARRRKSHYG